MRQLVWLQRQLLRCEPPAAAAVTRLTDELLAAAGERPAPVTDGDPAEQVALLDLRQVNLVPDPVTPVAAAEVGT